MKRDGLADLVDGFGRTADAPFVLDELLGFLEERTGRVVDEREAFDLAASSCYLFESWSDPLTTRFIPRRRFFQAAEFLITPVKEEVQGGILFPGHRFMPFICRDVFPADAWLLLADRAAPHVKRVDFPKVLADESLRFYGDTHASEYLESDHPANKGAAGTVSVSVFDLRDFYLANGFKPGDSIKVTVLDWLQGVLSLSHVPDGMPEVDPAREWTAAMRAAHGRMQAELGSVGDCYEQLAIMMLLGAEEGGYPLMKNPPIALDRFIECQPDILLQDAGDRAVLCSMGAMPASAIEDDASGASMTPLDALFKKLGIPIVEAEAEAYMRDALYRNEGGADHVLSRIFAGRPLVFRSPGEQEEFHRLWDELWAEVAAGYSGDNDVHGRLRSDLLMLKDRCMALPRTLAHPGELVNKPGIRKFSILSASLSTVLAQLNTGNAEGVAGNLDSITAVIFREMPKVLDTITG